MFPRQRSQEAESALAEVGAATLCLKALHLGWDPQVRDRAEGDSFLLETRESHAVRSFGLPSPETQGPSPSGREKLFLLRVYDPQGGTTPYPGWQTDSGRVSDKTDPEGRVRVAFYKWTRKEWFYLCEEALGILHQ